MSGSGSLAPTAERWSSADPTVRGTRSATRRSRWARSFARRARAAVSDGRGMACRGATRRRRPATGTAASCCQREDCVLEMSRLERVCAAAGGRTVRLPARRPRPGSLVHLAQQLAGLASVVRLSPPVLRRDRRQPPGRGIAVGEALCPRGTVDQPRSFEPAADLGDSADESAGLAHVPLRPTGGRTRTNWKPASAMAPILAFAHEPRCVAMALAAARSSSEAIRRLANTQCSSCFPSGRPSCSHSAWARALTFAARSVFAGSVMVVPFREFDCRQGPRLLILTRPAAGAQHSRRSVKPPTASGDRPLQTGATFTPGLHVGRAANTTPARGISAPELRQVLSSRRQAGSLAFSGAFKG